MKKTFFLLIPLTIILVISSFLVSCKSEPEIKYYTVTFKYPDGQQDVVKKVLHGEKVESAKAPEPKDEKCMFLYWTADIESNEVFNFDTTPIEGDLILHPVFGKKEFTITFIGAEGISSVPEQQTIEYGQKAEDPKSTAEEGFFFRGWRTDESKDLWLIRFFVVQ